MVLNTFTLLCVYHHHPCISRTFSSSQTASLHPLNTNSPFLAQQPLSATTLLPVSTNMTTLGASYKWDHTVFVLLYLAYFT